MRIVVGRVLQATSSSRSSASICAQLRVPLRAMSSSRDRVPPTSEKPVPLDKSPENWFAKFSRPIETPSDCFRGFSDRFNGITVDSALESADTDFAQKLECSFVDL